MKSFHSFLALLIALMFAFSFPAFAEEEIDLHGNIRSLLEMTLKDFPYYEIVGNESGYVIRIATDGMGLSAMLTSIGLQTRDNWQSYIDEATDWANSISEFIKVCGVETPNLLIIVVDEFEWKETILAIYNGQVIFDYAPAK